MAHAQLDPAQREESASAYACGGVGMRTRSILLAVLGGAATMWLLDPHAGRRRRALVRDKAGRYARRTSMLTGRMMRRMTGRARGAAHTLTTAAPWHETVAPPDRDQFIKERVESELGHDTDLPLSALNFDAVDGIVRVRGTVADEAIARRIVDKVAAVDRVRAAVSLLHRPDGTSIDAVAGDADVRSVPARAAVYAGAMRTSLMQRWPQLTDDDILASEGHIDRLVAIISSRAGQSAQEVRPALDAIVQTGV